MAMKTPHSRKERRKDRTKNNLAKLTAARALNYVARHHPSRYHKLRRYESRAAQDAASSDAMSAKASAESKEISHLGERPPPPPSPPYVRKPNVVNDHVVATRVRGIVKRGGAPLTRLEKNVLKMKAYAVAAQNRVTQV